MMGARKHCVDLRFEPVAGIADEVYTNAKFGSFNVSAVWRAFSAGAIEVTRCWATFEPPFCESLLRWQDLDPEALKSRAPGRVRVPVLMIETEPNARMDGRGLLLIDGNHRITAAFLKAGRRGVQMPTVIVKHHEVDRFRLRAFALFDDGTERLLTPTELLDPIWGTYTSPPHANRPITTRLQ